MAFYSSKPESALRLGDIVRGFPVATPVSHNPIHDGSGDLSIVVSRPKYLAVLTPCCSIENKVISLAPLEPIRPKFLENPYFEADLTRINRVVEPSNSIPPAAWEKMDAGRKQTMIAEGANYTFLDLFIYAPNDLLEPYQLDAKGRGRVDIDFHQISFKHIFRLDCTQINRDSNAPPSMKLLQLTAFTRKELREKLSSFFHRAAREDEDEMLVA